MAILLNYIILFLFSPESLLHIFKLNDVCNMNRICPKNFCPFFFFSMNDIAYYETSLDYKDFLEKHLIPNQPALFGPKLTQDWKARKEWVVPHHDSSPQFKPNYNYLRDHFGDAQVQIAQCHVRHFTDQERCEMNFKEFCQLWEADQGKESEYYLKDWHFVKAFPDEEAYQVPDIFKGKT